MSVCPPWAPDLILRRLIPDGAAPLVYFAHSEVSCAKLFEASQSGLPQFTHTLDDRLLAFACPIRLAPLATTGGSALAVTGAAQLEHDLRFVVLGEDTHHLAECDPGVFITQGDGCMTRS
jgi:hypothetical protein